MVTRRKSCKPGAFTLIELLVAVSILLILAGLGIENYARSYAAAKRARVLSDFRAIATGIEAYTVDQSAYPRMAHWGFYQDPDFDTMFGHKVNGIISIALTTPVPYLTSCNRIDPFMADATSFPLDERLYTYQVIPEYVVRVPSSDFWPKANAYHGAWRLGSVGPDQRFDHNFANSSQLPYDPTNGVVSLGNIWYCQRGSLTSLPPIPDLLGSH